MQIQTGSPGLISESCKHIIQVEWRRGEGEGRERGWRQRIPLRRGQVPFEADGACPTYGNWSSLPSILWSTCRVTRVGVAVHDGLVTQGPRGSYGPLRDWQRGR